MFKKISVITICLLALQLMSFGVGVGTRSALASAAPVGEPLTVLTVNHPLPGITVDPPVGGIYTIVPDLDSEDQFISLSVDVTDADDDLNTDPVPVYIDGGLISNGNMVYVSGDKWNYVPGTSVKFKPGVHNLLATFSDEESNLTPLTARFNTVATITAISPITGVPKVGQLLTSGMLTPINSTATYQWQEADTAGGLYADITGATTDTYTPTMADVGKYLRVVATGSGYYLGTIESEPTGPINLTTVNLNAVAGVTIPALGGVPVASITETDQYTGVVTWVPSNNPFTSSTVFTATIALTPKTGYTLSGVTENFFTVTGATATNAIDSGVITAVFTKTEALGMVQNLTVTIDGSGNAYLSWTNPPTGTFAGIRILRDGAPLVSLDPSATSFVDLTAEKGKTYFYQVAVYDSASSMTITAPIYVSVPVPVSNLIASAGISDSQEITAAAATDKKDVKGDIKIDLNKSKDEEKKDSLPWWGILLLIVLVLVGAYLLFTQRPKNEPPQPAPMTTKPKTNPKKTTRKTTKK